MELREEWEKLEEQIEATNRELAQSAKKDDSCQRLLTIPGIGPLTATALTAAIGNGTAFRKSRDLAAWLGLVPRQHSPAPERGRGGGHLSRRHIERRQSGAAFQEFALLGRRIAGRRG